MVLFGLRASRVNPTEQRVRLKFDSESHHSAANFHLKDTVFAEFELKIIIKFPVLCKKRSWRVIAGPVKLGSRWIRGSSQLIEVEDHGSDQSADVITFSLGPNSERKVRPRLKCTSTQSQADIYGADTLSLCSPGQCSGKFSPRNIFGVPELENYNSNGWLIGSTLDSAVSDFNFGQPMVSTSDAVTQLTSEGREQNLCFDQSLQVERLNSQGEDGQQLPLVTEGVGSLGSHLVQSRELGQSEYTVSFQGENGNDGGSVAHGNFLQSLSPAGYSRALLEKDIPAVQQPFVAGQREFSTRLQRGNENVEPDFSYQGLHGLLPGADSRQSGKGLEIEVKVDSSQDIYQQPVSLMHPGVLRPPRSSQRGSAIAETASEYQSLPSTSSQGGSARAETASGYQGLHSQFPGVDVRSSGQPSEAMRVFNTVDVRKQSEGSVQSQSSALFQRNSFQGWNHGVRAPPSYQGLPGLFPGAEMHSSGHQPDVEMLQPLNTADAKQQVAKLEIPAPLQRGNENTAASLESLFKGSSPEAIMESLLSIQRNVEKMKAALPHFPNGNWESSLGKREAAAAADAVTFMSKLAGAAAAIFPSIQQQRGVPVNSSTQVLGQTHERTVEKLTESLSRVHTSSTMPTVAGGASLPFNETASGSLGRTLENRGSGSGGFTESGRSSSSISNSLTGVGSGEKLELGNLGPASRSSPEGARSAFEEKSSAAENMRIGLDASGGKAAGSDHARKSTSSEDVRASWADTSEATSFSESELDWGNQFGDTTGDESRFLPVDNTSCRAVQILHTGDGSSTSEAPREMGNPGVGTSDEHETESDDEDFTEGEAVIDNDAFTLMQMDDSAILTDQSFPCNVCGKGFRRDANLKMHMRCHGARYKSSTPLIQSYNGPKPLPMDDSKNTRFSCPYVGCNRNAQHPKFRALKTMLCLKNHYKRSHTEKTLQCSRCKSKQFSVMADLKTHEKHCGSNNWLCSCGTLFSRKEKLRGHVSLFAGHRAMNTSLDSNVSGNRKLTSIRDSTKGKQQYLHQQDSSIEAPS